MAHLRRDARDGHSSATPVARRLKRPTRMTGPDRPAAQGCAPFLFGFAPGGVCRAVCVAANAVRSYRTFSPLPRKYATPRGGLLLCGTVPELAPRLRGDRPAGRYPAPFVRGARTFLPRTLSGLARAAVQPTDALRDGKRMRPRQGRNRSSSSRIPVFVGACRGLLARESISACSVIRVEESTTPSTRAGRK
jgi:hypothetical protein